MIYAAFADTTKNIQATARAVKDSGNDLALFGFTGVNVSAKYEASGINTEAAALAFFDSRGLTAMHVELLDGKLQARPLTQSDQPSQFSSARWNEGASVLCLSPHSRLQSGSLREIKEEAALMGQLVASFGFAEKMGLDLELDAGSTLGNLEFQLKSRGVDLSRAFEVRVSPEGTIRHKPLRVLKMESTRPLAAGASLKIEALAVAAIRDCAEEIDIFLTQVRHLHPELPVFVVTDAAGVGKISSDFILDEMVTIDLLTEDEIERGASRVSANDHGNRWSVEGIVAKFEALSRAIDWNKGAGVMLCDSDLVFTSRLPALEWQADLVLSSHQGAAHVCSSPPLHGFFNAGMLLTKDERIVARWRELFENGDGGFYEQKCLETLAEEFVTDLFPASWNWGGWRFHENLEATNRAPKILHCHLVGKWGEQGQSPSHKALRSLARSAIESVEASKRATQKILFVHYPKAAGSSMMTALHRESARLHFQVLNSWHEGANLGRDWSSDELGLIARGQLWGQDPAPRWIAHNHAQNITKANLEEFKRNGWQIFALYRPVRDRIVSGYFWGKGKFERGEGFFFDDVVNPAMSLEDHVAAIIDRGRRHFALSDGFELIDEWHEASGAGIHSAIESLLRCPPQYVAPWSNTSRSKGFEIARREGLISDELAHRISYNIDVKQWGSLGKSLGFDTSP